MMCKNHDQLHYHPALREVAVTLCGSRGAPELRDAMLMRATAEGLCLAAKLLSPYLTPMEQVRVRSRLEAVRAASVEQVLKYWDESEGLDLSEAPLADTPF